MVLEPVIEVCRCSPTKYGTSLPRIAPISINCVGVRLSFQSSFSPTSVAAASLDPPPRPAPMGMVFSRWMRAPGHAPVTRRSAPAAFITRLVGPQSSLGSSQVSVSVSLPASVKVRVSHRSSDCMTVEISWKPSSRLPRISRNQLILAGACRTTGKGRPHFFGAGAGAGVGAGFSAGLWGLGWCGLG
jgi:hypothetical protein